MDYLLVGIAAIVAIVGVTVIAPRIGVAAPLLLVLFGFAISLLPVVPPIEIDPELVLAGVLPPLLYSAAVSMPTMDFRRDFTAISGLSVLLVLISALLLGLFFTAVVPGIELSTGIALGAIVSPTDAVATSIVKRLGVSPRVVTVLEGESMLNDASALVLLRSAIVATAASVTLWGVALDFVWAVVAAAVIGAIIGRINLILRKRIAEPSLSTAISFVVPFVAYVPAEHLGASGLVAAVTAGLVTGQGSAKFLRPQDRMYEASNWRTIELLLEGGVFLLMGLELYGVLEDVRDAHDSTVRALLIGVATGAMILVIRAVYVLPLLISARNRRRRAPERRELIAGMQDQLDAGNIPERPGRGHGRQRSSDDPRAQQRDAEHEQRVRRRIRQLLADVDYVMAVPLGWREGVVLVWAGMRGVVTLAAAQSLPQDTPERSFLILIAFVVAAGTLLVQGGTLPWVVRVLGLAHDDEGEAAEAAQLRAELNRAAVALLEKPDLRASDGTPYDAEVLRLATERMRREIDREEEDSTETATVRAHMLELRLRTLEAERRALLRARSLGTYSSAALSEALRMLDADQISLELKARPLPGDPE
ncbi:sodium:proton antiporter [Mumia zhuanghuii]|uniref:Cation:proton antiporter n=2 Tax=Mumia TaxID=1546255 RepID=A0ABW1QG38_9ACTN|nr:MULTISPECIES: sodium:proton antiporter [Mumia]KAA1424726.1 sodium:proton antiporter [Mumia zhuanghuii]